MTRSKPALPAIDQSGIDTALALVKPQRKLREQQKFTVTILPMTERQQIQMYRNLVLAGERIRTEREATHAAD